MGNTENFLTAQSQMVSTEVQSWMQQAFFLMPTWKWLVLAIAFFGGLFLRPFIQYMIRKFKKGAPGSWEQKKNFGYYFLQLTIEQPLSWVVLFVIWNMAIDSVAIDGNAVKYLHHLINALTGFHTIKFLYLAVDALGRVLVDIVSKTESTADDQLAPFATKTLKVLVVVLGALMIFQGFGLNVMSLLAGLGLGGLALALAAQDTAANVFGSITILMDQPFKIGDYVKVQDVEGLVEEIGFRSTRVRTFYNSVVSIPNATVAKEKIDNMGERPMRRIRHTLGIHYDTPTKKIEEFCDGLRYAISQHDKVDKETVIVIFNGCGDSALNILVNFHIVVFDNVQENELQQKILLEALDLARKLKVDYAYPTRTVYMQTVQPPPALI